MITRCVGLMWPKMTCINHLRCRCTQDISSVDQRLTFFTLYLLSITLHFISTYAAAVWMVGLYALIPGIAVFAIGGSFALLYMNCQVAVKREMRQDTSFRSLHMPDRSATSNAKSPVLSQIGNALSSLSECFNPSNPYRRTISNLFQLP